MLNRDLLIGTIAIIASLLFLYIANFNNLGFSLDSMAYLEGAKNIKSGKGFVFDDGNLINHWPPLYSVVLALSSFITNTDLLYTGMYLHAILLIGMIYVINMILYECRINKFLSIFIIVLLLISAPFKIFLWQLSEGLFMFLVLFSFYHFIIWLKTNNRKSLILTGVLSSLFFLTRFAGIGFIAAYLVIMLFISYRYNSKNIKNLVFYLIPLFVIVMPWLIYAKAMDSGIPDRSITIQMISEKKYWEFISVIKNWFFGSYFAAKSAPFILLIILFEIIKYKKRFLKLISGYFIQFKKLIYVSTTSIIFYTAFIFFSSSFFYDAIPFDNRILFPIFPLSILIIASILQYAFKNGFKLIFFSLSAFLLMSFATSGIPVYKDYFNNGLGFTKNTWKESPTLDFISKDENTLYYSNATELLKLHTNKVATVFPNYSKKEQLQRIKQELENESAQIVIIENFGWPDYLVPKNLILKEFRNFKFQYFKDGLMISGPSIGNKVEANKDK